MKFELEDDIYTENSIFVSEQDELMHYGIKRRSGRYPWGSGDDPFQSSGDFYTRVKELEDSGLKTSEIARILSADREVPYTTTEIKAWYSIAKNDRRRDMVSMAKSLKEDGLNNVEIGKKIGEKYNNGKPIIEGTIRSFLNSDRERNMNKALKTAEELKDVVDAKKYIDIGKGVESILGVKENTLKQAVAILEAEGYEVYNLKQKQVTNAGNWTTVQALCSPGTTYSETYKARDNNLIALPMEYKEAITREDGKPNGFIYPESMDGKRVYVRPVEEGGKAMDGVSLIRPGVKDLSLGNSVYSQVRILVDGKYYVKGMAMYGKPEEFPPGVDLIFNSKHTIAELGEDRIANGLKEIKDDPENPFGANIKESGGQSFYDNPNGKYTNPITGQKQSLSLINKRSDEGDWDAYAKVLPSQFLSKQSKSLITKQLNMSKDDKQAEFDEIMSITNPTIKRSMLEDFALDCDKSAVDLKAASLPGQKYKVLLPINSLGDNEVYAPHLKDGSRVALVRYPHGGIFEMPICTVNNKNEEGKQYLTTTPKDAIGINSKTASQLSGADFDGDYVMCLPVQYDKEFQNKPPLEGLKNFDTEDYAAEQYDKKTKIGIRNGIKFKNMSNTQIEMGKISNLITDMTLKGADDNELERAVKHSMVVIDAEKHHLDYKQSYIDNNIGELVEKYQNHTDGKRAGGASTLISKAGSVSLVVKRKQGAYFDKETQTQLDIYDKQKGLFINKETGEIYDRSQVNRYDFDPKTGEKAWTYSEPESYTYFKADIRQEDGSKKKVDVYKDSKTGEYYYKNKETGEYIFVSEEDIKPYERKDESTKMYETEDARTLISDYNTVQENLYADYANKLKSLANQARLETLMIKDNPTNIEAKKEYKEEIDDLEYQYNQANINKPKERLAQRIANNKLNQIFEDNPSMDKDHRNKRKQIELKKARELVGAKRVELVISDRQWEAIQAGAVSPTKLREYIKVADSDRLKELALPRNKYNISAPKQARITAMSKNGYTIEEIASRLGISQSSVTKYMNRGDNNGNES